MINLIQIIEQYLNIPLGLLSAICMVESNHTNVINHLDYGSPSYGVCQIKLSTARLFDKAVSPTMLMEPLINIYYAGLYLKSNLRKYNTDIDCAIAAYNAGVCKKKKLSGNSGKLIKNQEYVDKVKRIWKL